MFSWWARRGFPLLAVVLVVGSDWSLAQPRSQPPPLPSIAARKLIISGHYDSQGKLEDGRIVWWEWRGEVEVRLGRARVKTELVRYEAEGPQLLFPRGLRLVTDYLDLEARQGLVLPGEDRFVLGNGAEGRIHSNKLASPVRVRCERVEGKLEADGGGVVHLTGGVEVSSGRVDVVAPEVTLDLTQGRLSVPSGEGVEATLRLPRLPRPHLSSSTAKLSGEGLEASWEREGSFSFTLNKARVELAPMVLSSARVEGEGNRQQGLVMVQGPPGEGEVRLSLGDFPEPGETTRISARSFRLEMVRRRLTLSGGVVLEGPTGRMETEEVWITFLAQGDYVIELPSPSRVVIDDAEVGQMLEEEGDGQGSREASQRGG